MRIFPSILNQPASQSVCLLFRALSLRCVRIPRYGNWLLLFRIFLSMSLSFSHFEFDIDATLRLRKPLQTIVAYLITRALARQKQRTETDDEEYFQ